MFEEGFIRDLAKAVASEVLQQRVVAPPSVARSGGDVSRDDESCPQVQSFRRKDSSGENRQKVAI